MNRFRVVCIYIGFAAVFAVVLAVMLVLLVIAVVGIPMGLMLGVFGAAMIFFKADFIITWLAPQLMLFGGISGAFASAFCGLLAVKAGFMVSRLFLKAKRRCDKLRGW